MQATHDPDATPSHSAHLPILPDRHIVDVVTVLFHVTDDAAGASVNLQHMAALQNPGAANNVSHWPPVPVQVGRFPLQLAVRLPVAAAQLHLNRSI